MWKWSRSVVSNSLRPHVGYQAPPCTGFSRREYWRGLPFLSPGDLPNPGIEPGSPTLQADTLTSEPPGLSFKTPWLLPSPTLSLISFSPYSLSHYSSWLWRSSFPIPSPPLRLSPTMVIRVWKTQDLRADSTHHHPKGSRILGSPSEPKPIRSKRAQSATWHHTKLQRYA